MNSERLEPRHGSCRHIATWPSSPDLFLPERTEEFGRVLPLLGLFRSACLNRHLRVSATTIYPSSSSWCSAVAAVASALPRYVSGFRGHSSCCFVLTPGRPCPPQPDRLVVALR